MDPDGTITAGKGCSVLTLLALSPADYEALARQGFVSAEQRGRSTAPYFRLRWRAKGQQRVRGLGREAARVERVRQELTILQQARRAERDVRPALRVARQALRAVKRRLEAPLAERGVRLHGYQGRRSRAARSDIHEEASIAPPWSPLGRANKKWMQPQAAHGPRALPLDMRNPTKEDTMSEILQPIECPPVEASLPAAPPPVRSEAAAATAQREERIQDLLAEALAQPDPLTANLGAIGSDLASFAFRLGAAIKHRLVDDPANPPVKEIDLHLRTVRQLDRLAQLQLTWRKQQDAAPPR